MTDNARCVVKARTTGKRCGNPADDAEFSRCCTAHGEMLRTGGELESFLPGGRPLTAATEPRAGAEAPPPPPLEELPAGEPQPLPPPPPPAEEPAPELDIPGDLFAGLELDGGPQAEPLAAVDRGGPPPPLEELPAVPGLPELPTPGTPGRPALSAGTWAKHAERALRGGVNPALRRLEVEELAADEVSWAAEVYGDWLAHVMAEVDPNDPTGAAVLCTGIVFGPRALQALQNRRTRGKRQTPEGQPLDVRKNGTAAPEAPAGATDPTPAGAWVGPRWGGS